MNPIYEIHKLAELYCPGSKGYNAKRRFLRMLKNEKDLWNRLEELNYRSYQRVFTPKQYEAIIKVLGEPEVYFESF